MMDFFEKRRKEKEEEKRKNGGQRRAQILEGLKEETTPHLLILRGIRDESPRESRVEGSHEFQFNRMTYGIQVGHIAEKLRKAEREAGSDFGLKDVGTSKEELDDIRLAAIRADIIVDGPEFGLIVTERPNSESFAGNVVGCAEL